MYKYKYTVKLVKKMELQVIGKFSVLDRFFFLATTLSVTNVFLYSARAVENCRLR